MPSTCCVTGCTSNYSNKVSANITVFQFPKDEVRKQKWLTAIPRADFNPSNRSVVCILHFDDRFIVREDTVTRADGSTLTVKRDRLKLTHDAYPTRFENVPSYLSKELPVPRRDPIKRKQEIETRIEKKKMAEEAEDTIENFNALKGNWNDKFRITNTNVFTTFNHDSVYIFKIRSTNKDTPELESSVVIDNELKIRAFSNGILINDNPSLKNIVKDGNIKKWSQLYNVCSLIFDSTCDFNLSVQDNLDEINRLVDDIAGRFEDNKIIDKLMFCKQQLKLAVSSKVSYCATSLAWFASVFFAFPGAYKKIRQSNFLTMPHPAYLKTFTSKLGVGKSGIDDSHWKYLRKKVALLSDNERLCNLLLDEVYVKPELSYRGGKLEGVALNSNIDKNDVTLATTVQTFMISSIVKKNKEIVGLFPCTNLTANYLHETVLEILKMLSEIGFKVLSIISDNNSVNRSMFQLLCGGSLNTCFKNPFDKSQTIFLLFDTVHIFKCIRNNWLNQTDSNQTFIVPDFEDLASDKKHFACVSHLKILYREEENNLIKLAPALSKKVLFPTSLERQNVNLCCRLFDEKNIAALQERSRRKQSDEYNGTIMFLQTVLNWWKIVNVKHAFKGDRFKDPNQDAIFDLKDENFSYLKKFLSWVNKWKDISFQGDMYLTRPKVKNHGKLTEQTQIALSHTTQALIDIVSYLKNTLNYRYVLLGKFQTDDLEERFGQYRLMSGACYNISVQQVLESEKKLKALSIIKAYSSKYDDIPLTEMFNFELADKAIDDVPASSKDIELFENVLFEADEITVSDETLLGLAYIGGYICKTICQYVNCETCMSKLVSNNNISSNAIPKESNHYFNVIDRGGLKYPSDRVINIILSGFKVFSVLIGDRYEQDFLNCNSHRSLFMNIVLNAVGSFQNEKCNNCGIYFETLVNKCVFHFSNILLNNYRKRITEKQSKKKEKSPSVDKNNNAKSSKKRKIAKLCS